MPSARTVAALVERTGSGSSGCRGAAGGVSAPVAVSVMVLAEHVTVGTARRDDPQSPDTGTNYGVMYAAPGPLTKVGTTASRNERVDHEVTGAETPRS